MSPRISSVERAYGEMALATVMRPLAPSSTSVIPADFICRLCRCRCITPIFFEAMMVAGPARICAGCYHQLKEVRL